MITILLVDDEENFRERLARAFRRRHYEVDEAGNLAEALAQLRVKKPMMAIFDLKMPGGSGLALVREALTIVPELKIVILTGYGSIATAIEAVKLGALSYLSKPAEVDDILNAFAKDPDLALDLKESDLQAPSLARVEWEHINRVLNDCGGNISQAAKRLGIHRRSLQRKLQKYPPGS